MNIIEVRIPMTGVYLYFDLPKYDEFSMLLVFIEFRIKNYQMKQVWKIKKKIKNHNVICALLDKLLLKSNTITLFVV